MERKSRRSVRLVFTTFCYLVFGAIVFGYFEQDADAELRAQVEAQHKIMHLKYNFSEEDFYLLEKTVITAMPFSAGHQWKFTGAFYFCTVVITTVGYGHSTPATVAGKLFYMLFSLAGIPLGLIMFQSIGERVNAFFKFIMVEVRNLLALCGISVLREIRPIHLLVTSSSIGLLIIALGTAVFHQQEQWSVFDAFYYCVITCKSGLRMKQPHSVSTIGLGDRVAAQTDDRLEKDLPYLLFTLCFILFGLAIFSASINLLVLEFMAHNSDSVTTGNRLRRLLSLRRSIQLGNKSASSRNLKNSARYPGNERDNRVINERDLMQIIYHHCPNKPVKYAIRRPPLSYVEHLANVRSTYL